MSSAFGRAMESVDTTANCLAVFGALKALKARAAGGAGDRAVRSLIAVVAEGYPFPGVSAVRLRRQERGRRRRQGRAHRRERGRHRRRG